ncbi:zinc finger domain-containing protein [Salpingoeca rosetta]|uniref:Zinc finger domain-containing protein n=1 Tax=Salpingoeca rosetta (strain ATCC 50818 / BSB-021) TaxID=946362 RepID=F2TWI0_SALR5|nr:zinc finger domain-containing protein [Salpingoeca rosetta]EGD72426.1 zinc finger domain-containing protein [Salpingoeca rosetta]|eukprot:XP_004998995.1 zinc finger domain-containing protein [Salpingoeca rosetta]
MSEKELVTWAAKELARLSTDLDVDTAQDQVQYMMGMDERDFREFSADIAGGASSRVKSFQDAFIRKRTALKAARAEAKQAKKKQQQQQQQQQEQQAAEASAASKAEQQSSNSKQAATTTTTTKKKKKTTKKQEASQQSSSASTSASASNTGLSSASSSGKTKAAANKGSERSAKAASSFMSGISSNVAAASSSSSSSSRAARTSRQKSKVKYVDFMDKSGKSAVSDLVPGRQPCECLATTHALINNCLQCGRIVCEQEGMGPCMTCGALVVTPDKQQLLQRNSIQAKKFLERLMKSTNVDSKMDMDVFRRSALVSGGKDVTEGLARALARKNMLLDFDRNSAKRTRVIDDQADYFSTDANKYLSRKQRDELRAREEQLRQEQKDARRNRTITIDFAGRRVIDSGPQVVDVYAKAKQEQEVEEERERERVRRIVKPKPDVQGLGENPMLQGQMKRPTFKKGVLPEQDQHGTDKQQQQQQHQHRHAASRIQDSGLSEMTDGGYCLSMHQPWASLLIKGIKMHEGRVWYSSHRGRLWIAAAAKQPEPEDIADVEQQLRDHYDRDFDFPTEYPTACLLGYVDVTDVLPQEEYRQRFPNGPSMMPFVFICDNPHELVIKYPVKGQHKIWKLDRTMHANAKAALQAVPANEIAVPDTN